MCKGVRRVIGIPYKTHTALLGPIIDSCQVSIVLVKLFLQICGFDVDKR